MSTPGPVYEVTLSIDRDLVEAFDAWLGEHVAEMLELPGFARAEVFEIEDDEQNRARRVCQYTLDSEADLSHYFAEAAEAMRQSGIDRFGDKMHASRRVLRATDLADAGNTPAQHCLNCNTILSGQYCASCGQRASSRLISIVELLRDAFGDLFELDSRLWRTVVPLLTRPGQLTRDYLEGRRARYMPPFRTYLVLSILFFFASFFSPKDELGFFFEPAPEVSESTESSAQEANNDNATPAEIRDQIGADLADEGVIVSIDPDVQDADDDPSGPSLSIGTDSAKCDFGDADSVDMPAWLGKRLTKARLEQVCKAVTADEGRAFLDKLKDNGPVALIVLLPLMALVQKALYPLSKRYYVEHLLFFVHYHAFFFLILTLQVSLSRIAEITGMPSGFINATLMATSIYIPVYLYKAMRHVYGQGHIVTGAKFVVLTLAYFFGLMSLFLVSAVIAAFAVAG